MASLDDGRPGAYRPRTCRWFCGAALLALGGALWCGPGPTAVANAVAYHSPVTPAAGTEPALRSLVVGPGGPAARSRRGALQTGPGAAPGPLWTTAAKLAHRRPRRPLARPGPTQPPGPGPARPALCFAAALPAVAAVAAALTGRRPRRPPGSAPQSAPERAPLALCAMTSRACDDPGLGGAARRYAADAAAVARVLRHLRTAAPLEIAGRLMTCRPLGALDPRRLPPVAQTIATLDGGDLPPAALMVLRAVLYLGIGGLDEAHCLVTPVSSSKPEAFCEPPILNSRWKPDATYLHALLHRYEGGCVGPDGIVGWDNARFWGALVADDFGEHPVRPPTACRVLWS